MADYTRFPKPDKFGNYWYGRRNADTTTPAGPAIFPSKRLKDGCVVATGTFYVFTWTEFVCQGPGLKRFDTAAEALEELRERMQKC